MTSNPYAAFLRPEHGAAVALDPEETWWYWRGHEVHVARARRAQAPARLLVVHGAGAHGGALWPVASLLAARGLEVAAVDLPLYGRTISPDPAAVRYDDWVQLLVDLIEAEHDDRPLILLGASVGGLLSYEAAARSHRVAAVAATCLLDPLDWRARARMTRFGPLGILGGPLSGIARGRLARVMIPMRAVAPLSKMSRDAGLSRLCATDPLGGGARVPIGFLASYLRYRHASPTKAETPITLLHPGRDAWTPMELSVRLLRRIAAPSKAVVLRECGHFPIEEPGVTDLVTAVLGLAHNPPGRTSAASD